MVSAAAAALAGEVTADEIASGLLYPEISRLRDVSQVVARAVALRAREDGVTSDFGEHELSRIMNARLPIGDCRLAHTNLGGEITLIHARLPAGGANPGADGPNVYV